jgi:hypothetical protein
MIDVEMKTKEAERNEINKHIQEFLKKGGKINEIPSSKLTELKSMQRQHAESKLLRDNFGKGLAKNGKL